MNIIDTQHAARTDQAGFSAVHRRSLPKAWAAAMDQLRARRAAHAAHKTLERELASYSTPAERLELDAVLARYEPAEVADIHRIIDRRLVA